jgi:Type II secretion system (T2SS), protein E, N-terminal domain
MPFLGRRAINSEDDVLLRGALGATNGTIWDGDEYRPSGRVTILDSLGLPASLTQTQQRRLCSNVECASGWTRPWRNRRRPIFEGQWGCSGRCVLAMTRAAVHRELGDGTESAVPTPHRHRVPLGLLMLAQGWITHPQLRRALEAQRENGTGRIGDWLQSECSVEPEQVTRGLSMQWGCPVLTTEGFFPETMALVTPKLFVEEFGLLPLRVAGSHILYLGFEERLDASAVLAMERMTDLKVEIGLVTGTQFQSAHSRLLECDGIEMKQVIVANKDALAARMTAILEQKQPVASRLVRVHQYYWMRIWLEKGAVSKTGTLPRTGEDVSDYVFTIGREL